MKRLLALLLTALILLPIHAQSNVHDKARMIAETFLSQQVNHTKNISDNRTRRNTISRKQNGLELEYEICQDGKSLIYVFTDKQQNNFAMVTADETDPMVIAYSTNQAFEKDQIIPPVKAFMDTYAHISKVEKTMRKAETKEKNPIFPLVKTKWGQGSPYNIYSPDRTLVGCGPLAMGQIMKYYGHPTHGTGEHGGVNFAEETYDFSRMIEGYSSENSTSEVAKLLRHAGVACDAEYDWTGTGSSLSANVAAMCKYFGYSSEAAIEYRNDKSEEEWDALIYNELANRRPVIYTGWPENDNAGHIFIVDGYNDGYYHVNWGWEGRQDGYFLLNAMLDYNDGQFACIGLAPEGWTPKEEEPSDLITIGVCNGTNTIRQMINPYEAENGASSIIPGSYLSAYIGKNIVGVQIGLADDATDLQLNMNTVPYCNQKVGDGHAGWNTYMLESPVTVPDGDLNIGYIFDQKPGNHPAGGSYSEEYAIYNEINSYVDTPDGGGYCYWSTPLAFRLILADDTEMPASLRILDIKNVNVLSNSHFKTTGVIENTSCREINNYTLKYKIDDYPVKTLQMSQSLKKDEKAFFSLDIEDEITPGNHELRVWVDKVDGQQDAIPGNSNYYVVNPLLFNTVGDKAFPRTQVAMANVDIYCGFSWMYMGIQQETEKSIDKNCIFINHHVQNMGADPMADVAGTNGGGATPYLYVNGIHYDEYDFLPYFIASTEDLSLAKIEGKAYFTADKKQIIVNTTTSFAYEGKNNYRIDYVLVEEDMGPFEDADDVIFSHVTRGLYHTPIGIISTPYSPDMPQNNSYAIPLLRNIHDKNKLHVVALLIEDKSGEIVNAVDMSIEESTTPVFAFEKADLYLLCDVTERLNVIDSKVSKNNALDYTFTSSDENVVKILEDGFIRATGAGTAVITCHSKTESKTAQCNVTVKDWANVVTVETPGTLHNLIGLLDCDELKINGFLSAMDLRYIRALTGGYDEYSSDKGGTVRFLNLKDAKIAGDTLFVTKMDESTFSGNASEHKIFSEDLFPIEYLANSSLRIFIAPQTLKKASNESINSKYITFFDGLEELWYSISGEIHSLYLPSTLSNYQMGMLGSQTDYFWIDSHNPRYIADDNYLYTKDTGELIYFSNSGTYTLELPNWCKSVAGSLGDQSCGILEFVGLGIVDVSRLFISRDWNTVVFGPFVKNVDDGFAIYAQKLKEIVMPALEPPVLDYLKPSILQKEFSDVTLYVNPESIDLYKAHPEWSKFYIQPMTDEMLAEMEPLYNDIKIIQTDNHDYQLYDLHGRKVVAPTKGIYIRNKQKVLVH